MSLSPIGKRVLARRSSEGFRLGLTRGEKGSSHHLGGERSVERWLSTGISSKTDPAWSTFLQDGVYLKCPKSKSLKNMVLVFFFLAKKKTSTMFFMLFDNRKLENMDIHTFSAFWL